MDIYTFCRVQFVDDGKRIALAAEQCHLGVPSEVAEDVIARGHAREASVGEVAEAGGRSVKAPPAKPAKGKAVKEPAEEPVKEPDTKNEDLT